MIKLWHDRAWEDYCYWQRVDRKTLKKLNELIRDIERQGTGGLGKPEPLKHTLAGWWSRRIDETNRLVYRVRNDTLEISSCRGHY
ncbi:MAG: Txe/YoeB family addiction module toxin [Treponematales bacterium]|jgi:toxin YoeB